MLGLRKQFGSAISDLPAEINAKGFFFDYEQVGIFTINGGVPGGDTLTPVPVNAYGIYSFWARPYSDTYSNSYAVTFGYDHQQFDPYTLGNPWFYDNSNTMYGAIKIGTDGVSIEGGKSSGSGAGVPSRATLCYHNSTESLSGWNHYTILLTETFATGGGNLNFSSQLWINGVEKTWTVAVTNQQFADGYANIQPWTHVMFLGGFLGGSGVNQLRHPTAIDLCQFSFYSQFATTTATVNDLYLKDLGQLGYNSPTAYNEFDRYPFDAIQNNFNTQIDEFPSLNTDLFNGPRSAHTEYSIKAGLPYAGTGALASAYTITPRNQASIVKNPNKPTEVLEQ